MKIDKLKWVRDNYDWLIKWFDDCERIPKEELNCQTTTRCQIFVDNFFEDQDYNEVLRHHFENILMACIWSEHVMVKNSQQILTTMDGFYKLRNRLPLPSDKVGIRYWWADQKGERMLRYTPNRDGGGVKGKFLSDCRLEIDS